MANLISRLIIGVFGETIKQSYIFSLEDLKSLNQDLARKKCSISASSIEELEQYQDNRWVSIDSQPTSDEFFSDGKQVYEKLSVFVLANPGIHAEMIRGDYRHRRTRARESVIIEAFTDYIYGSETRKYHTFHVEIKTN